MPRSKTPALAQFLRGSLGLLVLRHVALRRGRDQSHSRRGGWSLRRALPPAPCCPSRAVLLGPAATGRYRDDAIQWKARRAHITLRAASIRSAWPNEFAVLRRQKALPPNVPMRCSRVPRRREIASARQFHEPHARRW